MSLSDARVPPSLWHQAFNDLPILRHRISVLAWEISLDCGLLISNVETMFTRKIVIRPGESGYLAVTCPSLSGCVSQGKIRQDALVNIREAIQVYIESLEEDGLPIPVDAVKAVEIAL